jgi:hypothetical protein
MLTASRPSLSVQVREAFSGYRHRQAVRRKRRARPPRSFPDGEGGGRRRIGSSRAALPWPRSRLPPPPFPAMRACASDWASWRWPASRPQRSSSPSTTLCGAAACSAIASAGGLSPRATPLRGASQAWALVSACWLVRTDILLVASEALVQLSYIPKVRTGRFERPQHEAAGLQPVELTAAQHPRKGTVCGAAIGRTACRTTV